MQRPRDLLQDFGGGQSESPAGFPIDIELPEEGASQVNGAALEEQDDGSLIVDLAPAAPAAITVDPEKDFDANLAIIMGAEADQMAGDMIAAIDDDIKSREEWSAGLADGIKLLGTRIEKRTKPFNGASGVWDPMMMEAVVKFWAIARGEVLPARGPTKTTIVGTTSPETSMQAARIMAWMNLYLTTTAREYYPDMDQLIFWLGLGGSMFKKVYQDPIKGRPVAPFIMPQNLIAPYTATSIESAPRITHLSEMTRRDIKLRMLKGIWREVEIGTPEVPSSGKDPIKDAADRAQGLTPPTAWRGDEIFPFYETNVDLDLTQFNSTRNLNKEARGLPLPYRMVIDKTTQRVVALHRNWNKGDTSFSKKRNIVQYKFLPGLGFYGFGYCHVLGSLASQGTTLRRQIIDAQTLAMFPGGLRVKGMRFDNNNRQIGPTEFPEVDTQGLPIQQAIMMTPYKEVTQVPLLTLQHNSESAKNLASNVDLAVGEGRQDAPVGTTVALMEGAMRLASASLKLFHTSFTEELGLFCDLFGKYLPDEPYPFPVPGGQMQIMRRDFDERIDVIPVSDPDAVTQTQRILRAEAKLRMAMQAPQLHNLREVYSQMYEAMGEDPEKIMAILPMPQQAQPLDPLSENQNAMMGGQLRAGLEQDHDAHISAHQPLAEVPAMMAHIAEHMALKMRVDVQRVLGITLPPMGTPMPPEIENQIAILVAKAMHVIKIEKGEMTQNEIVVAQLKLEAAQVANKVQIAMAQIQQKAHAEQLKFITAQRDREARERDSLLDAAANTADNNVPPVEYVRSILNIGRDQLDKTEGKTS
jgi:hypothetical protein